MASATAERTANATTAIAPTSSRMRGSIAGVAPRRAPRVALRAIPLLCLLDLHDDGQDHRPPLRSLVEERRDARVDRVLERRRLGEMLAGLRLREPIEDPLLCELDDLAGVVLGDEPFRHDVRAGHDRAGLLLDRDDHEEDAVASDREAIAHDPLTHVPHPKAVDIDETGLHPVADARALLVAGVH